MTEICKIDGTKHKSFISLTRYVKKLGFDFKEYYDNFLKQENEGVCPNCGGNTPFIKCKYRKFCDINCSAPYLGKLNKPTFNAESKLKLSNSLKSRDPVWKEKQTNTWIKNYGSVFELKSRISRNRIDNMSKEEYDSFIETFILNQGKSKSKKFKEYILGETTILIQGYENFVLDILQKFYVPDEIFVGRSKDKMVKYIDENHISRRYFPDIYLPDNVIVEVKCPYTLINNFDNTMLKLKFSYEQGYKPILVIWETRSDRVEMCKKSLIETISSQAWNCTGRFRDYPFIGVGHKQTVSEALGIQI